ncbi:MAG TPA: hypothetical protein VFM05_11630 [Candidatus Saccharimonadales bacterium]|nr:hypothetical protein [Candidatus Saccharimonadales bacterium]
MSEQIKSKQNFFHLALEGDEIKLSPELRALVADFTEQMIEEYEARKKNCYDLLKAYPDDEGLKQMWTPEKIEAYASGADRPDAVERLRATVFHHVRWDDLMAAHEQDPEQAAACLQAIYERAGDFVRAGLLSSNALDLKMPFERGQFSYIRMRFQEEWDPRGGIEASMVDTLAQCYIAWQYWLKRAFQAANNMDSASEQMAKKKTRYEGGAWDPPRVTAVAYLDHCTQMADRFNRMFLRVLRQMRDLRRYSVPVTINNPKQVNIAADGGQQVNVQKSKRKQKKAAAGTKKELSR